MFRKYQNTLPGGLSSHIQKNTQQIKQIREGDRILRLGGPKKISEARLFSSENFLTSLPLEFALLSLASRFCLQTLF